MVQVVAWCREATSHYLGQNWSRSMSPYGISRLQWVKLVTSWDYFRTIKSVISYGLDHAMMSVSINTYMIFALCTAVTFLRPCFVAKSKANLAIRREFSRVMIFKHSTTPPTLWNQRNFIKFMLWIPCNPIYWWLSARLHYLQCFSNGDTAVLH